MGFFETFIVSDFILLFVSLVLLVYSIQHFKEHERLSLFIILIVAAALILAGSELLMYFCQYVWENIPLLTIFSVIGYITRPACLYLFILLSRNKSYGKLFYLTAIPLLINVIIFMLCFFPVIKHSVVVYAYSEDGSRIVFGGGNLRFFSHAISLLYLLLLIFNSVSMLRAKHLNHAFVILICASFVVAAVVIETFFNANGDIHVLNPTIAVGAMAYYLFLYIEKSQVDTLTNLFNRETYYHDLAKMDKSLTGIIMFDMNGLKYINDNYGHTEGDKALEVISGCILKTAKNSMYAYRIGGDEFIVIANKNTEEEIVSTIDRFKVSLFKTNYHCSIGYAYRADKSTPTIDLLKQAEVMMYKDKEEFYKNSSFERRKALHN